MVTCHFSEICTRVLALYLRQNFVSAQYPDNRLVEFHQILYMHSSWQEKVFHEYEEYHKICHLLQ